MNTQLIYDAITPIVTAVADAVGADIAWPGWTEKKGRPYYTVNVILGQPQPFGLDRIDQHSGVIMLSCREIPGKGARAGRNAAAAMAGAFPRGRRIMLEDSSVMLINRAPHMPSELQEGALVAYSITVTFLILK